MRILQLYVLAFLLIISSVSFAGGWTGLSTISQIRTNTDLILISGNDLDSGNPDYCDIPAPFIMRTALPDYPEMYALLVASYLQGKLVNLYVNGCTEMYGWSYPSVSAMISTH